MIHALLIIRTLLLCLAGFFLPKVLKEAGVSRGWRIGLFIIFLIIALLSCSKEETNYKPVLPPDRVMPVPQVKLEKPC